MGVDGAVTPPSILDAITGVAGGDVGDPTGAVPAHVPWPAAAVEPPAAGPDPVEAARVALEAHGQAVLRVTRTREWIRIAQEKLASYEAAVRAAEGELERLGLRAARGKGRPPRLAPVGGGSIEDSVLGALAAGPVSAALIADRVGVAGRSVSLALKRLKAKGLVHTMGRGPGTLWERSEEVPGDA